MKKLITWLIVLSLFGGLGYMIYQNGGIPSEGFNIGETIGTGSAESGVQQETNPEDERERPQDYAIVRKIQKIDAYSGQRLTLGYSLAYHVDRPEHHQYYNNEEYISAITGITDFSNVVGAASSHNSTANAEGAFLELLIEFVPGTDVETIAENIKEFFVPSEYSLGADEYNAYFDDLTKEDVFVQYKDHYIFIVVIDPDIIGITKSVKPEKLIDTFMAVDMEAIEAE